MTMLDLSNRVSFLMTWILSGLTAVFASLAIMASTAVGAETTTSVSLAPAARALSMTAGPDGNLWFSGFRYFGDIYDEIGRVTPSGQVTEFPLPTRIPRETGIPAIVTGPDNNLWFTEKGASKIGRITTSGQITEFSLPSGDRQPAGIAAGPDGNLWFTEEAGNKIGRISTSGTIAEFSLPSGSGPAGIAAGPDGNMWFTERNTSKIGRITTGGQITEFALPDGSNQPNAITTGPDGNLWFTEARPGQIGRVTPTGVITHFPIPVKTGTGAIAAGPAGDVWFTAGSAIGAISPSGAVAQPACLVTDCRLPPISLAAGPEGNLWFGAGTAITEGGGAAAILAANANGSVGKFFLPPLTVSIGLYARSVTGRWTDLRLSCSGGATGAECRGVLRLTKRIRMLSARRSRGARTLALARRPYELAPGESRRFPLRLNSRGVKLLSRQRFLSVRATATAQGQTASQPVILQRRTPRREGA